MSEQKDYLTIKEASDWATDHLGKSVTPSNIAYLINYGRIEKRGDNGSVKVARKDLAEYYESYQREIIWKKQLGDDLNWALSFEQYKESETTKTFTAFTRTKANSSRSLSNIFSTLAPTISNAKFSFKKKINRNYGTDKHRRFDLLD